MDNQRKKMRIPVKGICTADDPSSYCSIRLATAKELKSISHTNSVFVHMDRSMRYLPGGCWLTAVIDLVSKSSLLSDMDQVVYKWLCMVWHTHTSSRGYEMSMAVHTMPAFLRTFLRHYIRRRDGGTWFDVFGSSPLLALSEILEHSGLSYMEYTYDTVSVDELREGDLLQQWKYEGNEEYGMRKYYVHVVLPDDRLDITLEDAIGALAACEPALVPGDKPAAGRYGYIAGGIVIMKDHAMALTPDPTAKKKFRVCHDGRARQIHEIGKRDRTAQLQNIIVLVQFR
jgi:hypothetical protein